MSKAKIINIILNTIYALLIFIPIMLIATTIFLYLLIEQRAKCADKYGNDYSYSLDMKKCIDFKGSEKDL